MRAKNEPFFTRDPEFFKTLFRLLVVVALQNVVAYSVNMMDNIMLGNYSQEALSGAATVNQIFFMVQQFALSIGNTLVVIASQYWGKREVRPIRTLTGIALKLGIIVGGCILVICGLFPNLVLRIFTDSPEIIAEGHTYLMVVMWSFFLFLITQILMAALRAVETVNISFYISIASLIVNVGINYVLIFGRLGFPEMGIRGAAIGTLIARGMELVIILIYLARVDKKICMFEGDVWRFNRDLRKDYTKVYWPIMLSQVVWGISVPMQTAILGHLSANAIAANSVASTFYQYLKVIVQALSAVSTVIIGNTIGKGKEMQARMEARTLCVIDPIIDFVLSMVLIVLRRPLLSLYNLNDDAKALALQLIVLFAIVMVSMSYQMPVSFGIIQGAGDAQFTMKMNLISTWCIVMPLSFMSAFWWHWPVLLVVLMIQSDQFFKCFPVFIHFRKYTWMRHLTREEAT